eukprot:symbB.v1.2.025208.t1/scaffold2437.1/size79084/5
MVNAKLASCYRLEHLDRVLRSLGEEPRWQELPNTQRLHTCKRWKVCVSHYSSKNTILVQGKDTADASKELSAALEATPDMGETNSSQVTIVPKTAARVPSQKDTLSTWRPVPPEPAQPGPQPGEVWHLYVDGACPCNQNVQSVHHPAGWGIAIYLSAPNHGPMRLFRSLHGPVVVDQSSPLSLGAELGTNNTAELSAFGEERPAAIEMFCSNEFSRKALPPENLPPEYKSRRGSRRKRRSDSRSTEEGGRRKRRREKPQEEWSLGATHGAVAYGAWAARVEIANMLEMKCDPGRIIELVDRGVEGSHPMKTDNQAIPRFSDPVRIEDGYEEVQEKTPLPFVPSKGFTESQVAQSLFPEKEVKEVVEEQMAIMNALTGSDSEIPPWVKKSPDEPKAPPGESLAEREKTELERFKVVALEIYYAYQGLGIQMDLAQWVGEPKVDEAKFIFHVAPSRASTGNRYANLLMGHLNWVKSIHGSPLEGGAPLEKLRTVEYLEHIVQKGIGRYTPSSFLFALDYFSKAFGFDPTGAQWRRAKMLASRYTKASPELTDRAPQFSKETLLALERLVLDDLASAPERIAAGKLRLCCQASVRYDDLLHTPLSSLEWVRRKGEIAIVGVRARSTQGKVRARPWVASFMGADEKNDKWLSSLVTLLVSSHGRRWSSDDHLGKEVNRAGDGFTSKPARMETDVMAVKSGLMRLVNSGEDVGWVETLEDWSRKVWPQSGKGEKVGLDPSKAKVFEGVHASTLEESFLDGAFDQSGKVLFEQVDKDKEFEPEANEIDRFLESPGEGQDTYVVYNFEKPVESGAGRLEEKDLETSLPLEEGDEAQDEGLTASFVIAASGLSSSKLHLPAIDKDPSGNLLQGDLPITFKRAAIRFDVAESDFFLLGLYGVATLNGLAFKIPKSEDLEVFLQDKILDFGAYKQEDGTLITYQRTPKVSWREWKMSDDAASIRRLWQYAKETKGEMERMAGGEEVHRKLTLMEAVAMENAAIARGCPMPGSDRERPSLFTLNRLSRSLQTPGATYEIVPWEALLSKDEEDRLAREGKLPKGSHTEIVLSKDSKIVAKERSADSGPVVAKVEDMETLRARLDIRARALDMLDLVGYGAMRLLSDKYYGKVNAVVADGMRSPTLNELRRFDREMQVHVYRHLSRGIGSLEGAIQYYVSTDADNLWRLLDPVIKQLPDQGVEAASAESKKDGNKRKAEEVEAMGGGGKATKSPEPPRLKLCLVCHKRHEPLCKLPPDFRKNQRDAQKKAKAAKRAAKNSEKGDKAK